MMGAASMTLPLMARVARRREEAPGIVSFELRALDGGDLPPFTAGAHIDVQAPNGAIRQYSICNSPLERDRYLLGILDDPASRGGSRALHAMTGTGNVLRISAPRNHFALVPARRTLLLGGGIGITPMLAMAAELASQGRDFELHYCARSRARAAFLDLIAQSPWASRARLHLDDGAPDQRFDADAVLAGPADDTHVYICGPAGLIAHVRERAAAHGWASAQVHVEHFAAPAQDLPEAGAFDVRIASTGKVIRVAADQTAAGALSEHGIDIPLSCNEGVCGTCITGVLAGTPEHRDCYFTEEEKARNNQFMPCCSRSLDQTLVLDL
jgi:vanillate O-demethylase ferredoxin subunit